MSDAKINIHPSAVVDEGAVIGEGTAIWHFSHICSGAVVGVIAHLVKACLLRTRPCLEMALKYRTTWPFMEVSQLKTKFLGPSCVLTNVTNPRSQVSRKSLYEKTLIRRGATIGANATIVWDNSWQVLFYRCGAVVTKDVPDYGLVVGNPAKQEALW